MPLELKIKCGDETHRIHVMASMNLGGPDFIAKMVDHDENYEILATSLGEDPVDCLNYVDFIQDKISRIVNSGQPGMDFFARLLEATHEQGIEALGIHNKETFYDIIFDFINYAIGWISDNDEFRADKALKLVQKYHQQFTESHVFRGNRFRLAKYAVDGNKYEVLKDLCKMSEDPLVIVEVTEDKEESSHGMGHVKIVYDAKISIGEDTVDSWSFWWSGYINNYEDLEWGTEKSKTSLHWTTDELLEATGNAAKNIEDLFEPEKPKHLDYKYVKDGDWAILHDERIWEYFETEETAWKIFDSIVDAHDYFESYVGLFVTLVHRAPDPEREDEEDYEYDPKDPTTWESLSCTQV